MAAIRITPSELKAKASELQTLAENFKSSVTQLENQEGSLASMWEGEAKSSFSTAFKNDKTQMDNFYNAIMQYVHALNNIAAQYINAESRNQEIASTRNYH